MKTLFYIDGENLQYSLHNQYEIDLEPKKLLELSQTVGQILEARMYADFATFPSSVALKADAAGINLIHIPSYSSGQGNGKTKGITDHALELDCLERVMIETTVEAVIVASGDRGFVQLLKRLRRRGLSSIVVAVSDTTSWQLKEAADQFIAYPVQTDLEEKK